LCVIQEEMAVAAGSLAAPHILQGALCEPVVIQSVGKTVLSCRVWGRQWRGSCMLWLCDNQAAVQAVRSGFCRDQAMMHLILCLSFFKVWSVLNLWLSTSPAGRTCSLMTACNRFFLKAQSPDPSRTTPRSCKDTWNLASHHTCPDCT
jgi:hypothetical protein